MMPDTFTLPRKPYALLVRAYRPSGIWSKRALWILLGLGIPLSILAGIIGHYLGLVLTYVVTHLAPLLILAFACYMFLN